MDQEDDWIEAQLRARRIEPTADAGFSQRVLERLRARTVAPRWIVPTLTAFGALVTVLALPTAQLSSAVVLVTQPQTFLVLELVAAALVWIGSAWVLLDQSNRAL